MTVIAWDGKTLAADKQTSDGSSTLTVTKIRRAPNGALVGGCGNSSMCRQMYQWYVDGAKKETYPVKNEDTQILVITPEGKAHYYLDGPAPIVVENKFFAIGSGCDYAVAAMHCGRTASEAVAIACIYDPGCGHGIDTLTFEPLGVVDTRNWPFWMP